MDKEAPLTKQILKTTGMMVGACVLFLTVLSVITAILLRTPSAAEPNEPAPTKTSNAKHPS